MKLTHCLTVLVAVGLGLAGIMACQVSSESKNTATQPPVTTANSNQPVTAKTEADKPVAATAGGSLATPTDTYKTAFAARRDKDIQGLKRVLSQKLLGFLEEVAKSENKTVDDQLKELSANPQASTADTRNEKINGDKATLEYLGETGQWLPMNFVKEGNDWKMSLPEAGPPTMQEMKKPGK